MRSLVVAHPRTGQLRRTLPPTPRSPGSSGGRAHDVDRIDLYRGGLPGGDESCEERIAYDSDDPIIDPQVADLRGERLQRARGARVRLPVVVERAAQRS